jgi:hypothetical protein
MFKTLGFFLVQLFALMVIYPLWVRRSYKLSFWRWLPIALVACLLTSVILMVACYVGLACL